MGLPSLDLLRDLEASVTKIDDNEANKRIKEIAKNQKNFIDVDPSKVANEGDLISFDYVAKVDGNSFERLLWPNINVKILQGWMHGVVPERRGVSKARSQGEGRGKETETAGGRATRRRGWRVPSAACERARR